MTPLGFGIYIIAGFAASVFSGIAGGGAGFIVTPLMIVLGLTPAEAVATSKVSGLSLAVGSLGGLQRGQVRMQHSRRWLAVVMGLTIAVGLATPYLITSLESSIYRITMGVLILLMIPLMIVKRVGLKASRPGPIQRLAGLVLLVGALALQGMFSGGMATLVNVVMMGMLGMTALEANVTRRWTQLVLNAVIMAGIIATGLIVWPVALVSIPVTLLGGYVGGKMAGKRGNEFVLKVTIVLMVVSGIALIAGVGG